MLVVANEETSGICGQGGFSCTGKTKEQSDIVVLDANVGGRMK